MLWRGNAQGRCVYLNRAMRQFWGLGREECSTFDWSTSLLPEDRDKVFGPFSQGMERQEGFSCEGRYRRHDGEIRILRTRASPYRGTDGSFAGMIGVNEDLTDLRAAEQELERGNRELGAALAQHQTLNERLKLATNISGLAMSEHDGDLRYTWQHNLQVDALGRRPCELVEGDVGVSLERILGKTLQTGEPQSEELSLTVNEAQRWFDIQTARIVRADGTNGVVASALDITSRKLNEEKLQILARELSHRVKNVFAVVQAIVRQTARVNQVSKEFVATVEARLNALAQAQDALISMTENEVMVADLLHRQLSHLAGVRFGGPEVKIPGRLAPYLALAVHELSTNALKYGALSTPAGLVDLRWHQGAINQLSLVWEERGGPEAMFGEKRGFGSTLLTSVFSAATGGSAQLLPGAEGLTWTATFPIAPTLEMAR